MKAAYLAVPLWLCLAALTGCQQGPTPAQQEAARKAANEAAARVKLADFHQLVAIHRDDLAAAQGRLIRDNFPGTAAAASVASALPALEAKVAVAAKARRLASLWTYQVSPMAGGTQSTAGIYNSRPEGVRVHLVLRRHTQWGTSAFLYDAPDKGFVCARKPCRVVMHFDGHRETFAADLPVGGEPALMIEKYDRFIAQLGKADTVTMQVAIKGRGPVTLTYETGGFEASHWKRVGKRK